MSWIDLLRMSANNLRRRKLRTFLTVLGVMIGTTSIVVMISLGLGLEASMMKEIEASGGMNTITVTGAESGQQMYSSLDDSGESSDKRLTDSAVAELKALDHVVKAVPEYDMSAIMLKGKYEGYVELIALPSEALAELNLDLTPESRLPESGTSNLELIYGNTILTNFMEKGSGRGYYDTGELPDIDLARDTLFLILDTDNYYASQEVTFGSTAGESIGDSESAPKKAQKHAVRASGVIAGDVETYKTGSYNVYCDLDTLKNVLTKEFRGRAIPGQPTKKNGKPYKDFSYTSLQLKTDNQDNVDAVVKEIRTMGFNATTNAEYMESAKKEMAMIEGVLGGIGAVSLLVAAIGIANTMMMSIYERTKEIGIIKVLGCSLKNIRTMFLMEAAGIGLIGGATGVILSFILSGIINFLTSGSDSLMMEGNLSYIPLWLVLAAMGFSMLIGILAGYFPALRAMKLSPLAAIKTE